jgi:hypothetical protein
MRSRLLLLSMTVVLALAVAAGAADSKSYGKGVTLSTATPIARVLDKPADFQGKTIRVEGVITEVCEAMGCWMALAAEAPKAAQAEARTVLIQVEHDGVIVFPVTARGHRAAAQGVLEKISGGEGQEAAAELARQQGGAKEAPVQYRINATGAVIY